MMKKWSINIELKLLKIIKFKMSFIITVIISVIFLSFNVKAETTEEKMNDALEKIASLVDDNMTNIEKALAVHDYIILNCWYDTSLTNFSAYDCLVNSSAVCLGFAAAYNEVMWYLGFECRMLVSWEMNHVWNYIKIDCNWYHVDLTWDASPINFGDYFGRVKHRNFLLSDEGIKKTGHYGWEFEKLPKAENVTYDDYFWKDVDSGMFKVGKYWYYITKENATRNREDKSYKQPLAYIQRYDFNTSEIKNIYTISSTWRVRNENDLNERFYTKSFSKLAVDTKSGKLFFNTADCVYSIDIEGENLTEITNVQKQDGYIFGITLYDNKLKYLIKKDLK